MTFEPLRDLGTSDKPLLAKREINYDSPQKVSVDNFSEVQSEINLNSVSSFETDINHTATNLVSDIFADMTTFYQLQSATNPSKTSTITFTLPEIREVSMVYLKFSLQADNPTTTTRLITEYSENGTDYVSLNDETYTGTTAKMFEVSKGKIQYQKIRFRFISSSNITGNQLLKIYMFNQIGSSS